MKKYISTLLVVLFSFSSVSQTNSLEEKIKKELNFNDNDYFSFDLKQLPDNPKLSLVAVTKYVGKPEEGGFDCELILVLIETNSQKIIYKYVDKTKFSSDAIRLSSVTLDMANYSVSKNLRAFGVRSSYEGSSRANPYSNENMMLFIIQENKIHKILPDFEMSAFHGEYNMDCNYENEESNSFFIMQKEKSNGFYSILVKTKASITKAIPSKTDENDCVETVTEIKPTYKKLIYKNGIYQLKR